MKTSRTRVYELIDDERREQQSRPSLSPAPSVAAELVVLQHYVDKARAAFTSARPDSTEATMNAVRIIAAIAVRAMETHGAPVRVLSAQEGKAE